MTLVYARVEQVTDVHRRGCVEVNKLAFIAVAPLTFSTETYWPPSASTGTGLHTQENSPRTLFVIDAVRRGDELDFALIARINCAEPQKISYRISVEVRVAIFEHEINSPRI